MNVTNPQAAATATPPAPFSTLRSAASILPSIGAAFLSWLGRHVELTVGDMLCDRCNDVVMRPHDCPHALTGICADHGRVDVNKFAQCLECGSRCEGLRLKG